jgi:hypothetical protein
MMIYLSKEQTYAPPQRMCSLTCRHLGQQLGVETELDLETPAERLDQFHILPIG